MDAAWADEGTQLTVMRRFKAPSARIFRAFLDPHDLKKWIWANMGDPVEYEVDPRIGGKYRMYIRVPDANGWHTNLWGMQGVYIDIAPNRRLVYTLHWDAPVGYNQRGGVVTDEVVIVDFADKENETEVHMRHMGIPADGISVREHRKAVEGMFDVLARHVRS